MSDIINRIRLHIFVELEVTIDYGLYRNVIMIRRGTLVMIDRF